MFQMVDRQQNLGRAPVPEVPEATDQEGVFLIKGATPARQQAKLELMKHLAGTSGSFGVVIDKETGNMHVLTGKAAETLGGCTGS